MTITAPVDLELQHDDIDVVTDDITIVADRAPAATSAIQTPANEGHEPLMPFLALGVLNLIAMLAVAVLLAF